MSRMVQEKKLGAGRVVAVAIENNKTSQHAAKWAVDNLLPKDQILLLLHVSQRATSIPTPTGNLVSLDANDDLARVYKQQMDNESKELFASFRVFCNRKSIQCKEIILEDMDISKGLIEGISKYSVELLVLGAPSRSGLVRRFRTSDIPSVVSKGAPPFCTVYIISKGKISSVKTATSKPPSRNNTMQPQQPPSQTPERMDTPITHGSVPPQPSIEKTSLTVRHKPSDEDEIISPFTRPGRGSYRSYESSIMNDSDISFVSGGRPSTEKMFPSMYDEMDSGINSWLSTGSDFDVRSFGSSLSGAKSIDHADYSFTSQGSGSSAFSASDEVEAEMRRLKLELKQTMEMYSTACKEALTAKQKAIELQRWKVEEQRKLEEARFAQLEAQKRMSEESDHKKKNEDMISHSPARYRKYTIEEIEEATKLFSNSLKIGEGGYGPVYRTKLDHTQVAIKVLKSDAAQGRSQFQQEVEVLSCIRHPNLVLLLGACPEYGCLVYEYMANGSLEDCLFRKGNKQALPWQLRFRIAAEIATGLLFLHQTKPEPLVHRDLKPGNILLDRNYVSKISDVGLARLVPATVADTVTQYRMTSTAGTFCYIDPEYQQTGMLGIKSDVYSLGIMLLQMITAKPPMGLTHHVGRAIENGTFAEMLDPAVQDWPVEHAMHFAKLALACAEMRRKDRPDLGKVVLPELNKLRDFAEDNMPMMMMFAMSTPRNNNYYSSVQDTVSDSHSTSGMSSGYESRSSSSSVERM